MNTTAKKSGEGRLEDIAAAARALIAERGFEGLRTRDIAARVGINVATLHYHVPTKEELIGLVAKSIREDFIRQHQARPRDTLQPLDRLKAEFADFRDTRLNNPELFAVLAELSERARREENVAAHFEPMQRYWHRQIADLLAEGVRCGQFRPDLNPEAGALMIIGTLVATRRAPRIDTDFFDTVCDELLRALVASPTRFSPRIAKGT